MPSPTNKGRLTDAEVWSIRISKSSTRDIAKRHGCSRSVVSAIRRGELYKHAPGPITRKDRNPKLSDNEQRVIACLRFAQHLSAVELMQQSAEDGSELTDVVLVHKTLIELNERGFVERKPVKGARGDLFKMTRSGLDAWIAAGRPWSQLAEVVA